MPFRDIAGHRRLLELIARAASRGTLPPSLIFAGPDGVGKRKAALALAQLSNCLQPLGSDRGQTGVRPESDWGQTGVEVVSDPSLTPDACGECAACRRIARRVHADVLVLEPGDTGAIKIEQVREAIDRTAYRPFEGKRRFVIIDAAHEIIPAAQDALLKTLEEPPPASTFVLVTSRPDLLHITIRSRCQRLRFGRIPLDDVARVLVTEHAFSEADARAATALSDGSIGQALEGWTDANVETREAAARLLEGLAAARDPRARLNCALGLPGLGKKADRDRLARCLWAVSSLLRDLGVLVSRADESALANADLKPRLERLARSFDSERTLGAFAAVDRALNALDRNASPKIVADWLAFQI